jgi:tetratricopeptide (TPR) repeat protein
MSQQEEVRSTPAPESAKGAPKAPNGAAKNADALLEALANEAVEPPKPRSSLGRALRDVLIVGALLGGGLFLYRNNVTIRDKVQKIAVTASEKMQKDDLKSLREAEAAYNEILTLDADNKIGLSGLAETYFHQWRHGLDTKAKAEETLARAEKEGSETPERYATRAYLDVVSGRAADAERSIKAMFDQNAYHSKLAHAYGWALLEQGKLNDANQAVQGALDTDFSASRYALTLAEIALRRGGSRNAGDKAALKSLSKVLTSGMNQEHELALTMSAALRAKNYGNIDRPAKWIQTVEAKGADIGPVAKAQLAWASGELALALGDAKVALEKAEEALAIKKDYPPFYELKARALVAQGKTPDAYAAYDEALKVGPSWRSTKWAYAYLKSANKSDDALTMLQDLESTEPSATKGPEYEVFRGEHYLRQEKWADAKAAYTRAAELGDDAEILYGLAQITLGGWRTVQIAQRVHHTLCRLGIGRAGRETRGCPSGGHHRHLALHTVQHRHHRRPHQHSVGQANGVGVHIGQAFHQTDHVIAQIAKQPRRNGGQTCGQINAAFGQQRTQGIQWRCILRRKGRAVKTGLAVDKGARAFAFPNQIGL